MVIAYARPSFGNFVVDVERRRHAAREVMIVCRFAAQRLRYSDE